MDENVRMEILDAFREAKLGGDQEPWQAALLVLNKHFPDLDRLKAANKLMDVLIRDDDEKHTLSPAPFVIDAAVARLLQEEARRLYMMPDQLLTRIAKAWLSLVRDTEPDKSGNSETVSLSDVSLEREQAIKEEMSGQEEPITLIVTSSKARN